MFLYKALKHRDEEEDVQVHTQRLGDIGRAVALPVCLDVCAPCRAAKAGTQAGFQRWPPLKQN